METTEEKIRALKPRSEKKGQTELWTPVIFEDVSGGVTRETMFKWAEEDPSVLAITREEADDEVKRSHYHIVIRYDKPCEPKTVNNRINKHFPHIKPGKAGRSVSQWDGSDDIYDYIAKGRKDKKENFDLVFNRSGKDLQFHHDRWHERHEKIVSKKNKESNEERRERFIAETIEHFKGKKYSYIDISRYLFKLYKGRVMLNLLQPMAMSALFTLDPAQALMIHDNHVVAWLERNDPSR